MQYEERSLRMDRDRYGDARCDKQCKDRYENGDKKELVY